MDLITLMVGDGEDRKNKNKRKRGMWYGSWVWERVREGVCEGEWYGGERKTIKMNRIKTKMKLDIEYRVWYTFIYKWVRENNKACFLRPNLSQIALSLMLMLLAHSKIKMNGK